MDQQLDTKTHLKQRQIKSISGIKIYNNNTNCNKIKYSLCSGTRSTLSLPHKINISCSYFLATCSIYILYCCAPHHITGCLSLRWSSCTDFWLWESLCGTSLPSQCSSVSSGLFCSLSSCAQTPCLPAPQQAIRESCSSCSQGVVIRIISIPLFVCAWHHTGCISFSGGTWLKNVI